MGRNVGTFGTEIICAVGCSVLRVVDGHVGHVKVFCHVDDEAEIRFGYRSGAGEGCVFACLVKISLR